MAQSIGIHLGERGYHLLALDGSLKKHKVVCAISGEIPTGEDAGAELIEQLREAVKEHKLRPENVYLSIDSGVAAFRNLTLPFDDREKIEEVLKYEIEGNLPHFDIDEVVVDFLTLSSKPGVESNLLVTAVPKERLSAALHVCEKAGLEPLDSELEGTALFDAAFEAGLLDDEEGTVLVHVGETSTTVVVADGKRLASMRAIRAGAQARGEDAPTPGEGEEAVAVDAPSDDELHARLVGSTQRIRRELQRTLSGARTTNEIRTILVCGRELPGLMEPLLDVTVEPLQLELPGAEPVGSYVVAFGTALRGFAGGTLKPHLRREELRFSGRFERLEAPLAVFALLFFALLAIWYVILEKQLEWRDEGDLARNMKGDMQIWLEASNRYMFPDPTNPHPVRLANPPEALAKYAAEAEAGLDEERTKFQELNRIRQLQKVEIDRLSKELGQVSETTQPQSALTATTLVMNVVADMGEEVRMSIRRLDADYQSSATRGDSVMVSLDADFFDVSSIEATRDFNNFEDKIKAQPWCVEFESKSNKTLEGDKGIQADGITIQVNVEKAQKQEGQA